MFGRKSLTTILVTIFALALLTGALQADGGQESETIRSALHDINDYVAPQERNGIHFAVEDGSLYAGTPSRWQRIETPSDILVSAVAADYIDANNAPTIYIGAANALTVYHSQDFGENWATTTLSAQETGGITELTHDTNQKILYVGTDTSGIYRLRDAGATLQINNHVLIDQPILEIAADTNGAGIAYARTEWQLYRADQYGMRWFAINGLPSVPTALAIAGTTPATVYVGTVEQGIFKSTNGKEWTPHNRGLQIGAGTRLKIDALAVDQTNPDTLYASTSHMFGSRNTQIKPVGTFMTTDGTTWELMIAAEAGKQPIVDLFPVHGEAGTVFALTDQSATSQNLATDIQVLDSTTAAENAATQAETAATESATAASPWNTRTISWIVAGLAALALLFAALSDLLPGIRRQEESVSQSA